MVKLKPHFLRFFPVLAVILIMTSLTFGIAGCNGEDEEEASPNPEQNESEEPETITVVDYTGKYVEIELPIERIVSITAGASEIISALGQENRIVARDSYSIFPSGLEALPEVAERSSSPNIELIAAQEADLVIADTMLTDDLRETIEKNVPVFIVSTSRPEESLNAIKNIGLILDEQEKANELVDYINGYRDMVAERLADVADEDKPLVFWEWTKPYKTCNSEGAFHDIIVEAGGINIAAGELVTYPVISIEWLLEVNPDVIIKGPSGTIHTEETLGGAADEVKSRTELNICNAVINDNVYCINSDVRKSTRYFVGLLYYAKWLYPDLFADIDPSAIHQEYVTEFFGANAWENLGEIGGYPLP